MIFIWTQIGKFSKSEILIGCWILPDDWLANEIILKTNLSVADTLNAISQMEQVKFTCKLEPFQEDAGIVAISQGDLVSDSEFKLDLRSLVE